MNTISKFETLARLGFAGRGLIYVMIGYLALRYRESADAPEIMHSLNESAIGALVLLLIAVGLLGYGAWRLVEGALDLEGKGDDAKGMLLRTAHLLSGLLHIGLGGYALSVLADGSGERKGDESGSEQVAGWMLDIPGGYLLIGIVGAGLIATGLFQFLAAWRLDFLKHLLPRAANSQWVAWVGRLGYAARGVVFVLIGLFFWNAASSGRKSEAGGMDDALDWLNQDQLVVVGIGLVLFGLFCLVEAIYRRITSENVIGRLQAKARSHRL
ncbi:MAG: DUF1206 domain-containing protein [Sphingosinicella sp.]|nr:DUF1206 domain-containing protein [Sphingosinicella sp.]